MFWNKLRLKVVYFPIWWCKNRKCAMFGSLKTCSCKNWKSKILSSRVAIRKITWAVRTYMLFLYNIANNNKSNEKIILVCVYIQAISHKKKYYKYFIAIFYFYNQHICRNHYSVLNWCLKERIRLKQLYWIVNI